MPNRLAHETSPYLLQHAENPVDWYPWGEAAFARARAEDKPIFLSVGYSTCHWCHVMAHESFEDPATASLLNEAFVNVKVDREERPDVDRLYMAFVQGTTGHGGWPMSVWLTPDLRPFIGGTYFPPEDRAGHAGFPTVIRRISAAWRSQREAILEQSEATLESLRRFTAADEPLPDAEISAAALDAGRAAFARIYDEADAGFGGAPKFPRPTVLGFLLRESRRLAGAAEGAAAREMTSQTLRAMAKGGMYDHLGGGFHRYSVDAAWHVPHFEKMLYDQAQLVLAYVEAWQATAEPAFAATARETLAYVRRDLRHPEGAFFSAEDADSPRPENPREHAEGAYYVWSWDELSQLLSAADLDLAAAAYRLRSEGNVPAELDPHGELAGRNILHRGPEDETLARKFNAAPEALAARLAHIRGILFEARNRRPRPHRDEKVIAAWNGLMIAAFARAGAAFGDPAWIDCASQAARFVRQHMRRPETGQLDRIWSRTSPPSSAFAEDYASTIMGLLELHQATLDESWLEWAAELQEILDAHFWDDHAGGYFGSDGRDPSVLLRIKEDYDGAEPSATSLAASNLCRLARLLARPDYEDRARRALRSFGTRLRQAPLAVPMALASLDLALAPDRRLLILAPPSAPLDAWKPLAQAVHRRFEPHLVMRLSTQKGLAAWLPDVQNAPMPSGRPTAQLCVGATCRLPVESPEALTQALDAEP